MKTDVRYAALPIVFAALSAGCATALTPAPVISTPAQWLADGSVAGSLPTRDWFRGFGSQELDDLIENAYQGSLDLQAADARIRQADARARAAGSAILPQVDLDANSASYAGHSVNGSAHETDYGVLLSASYELDFWGKNRAARTAADALRNASTADRDVVMLTAITGVANTYFLAVSIREKTVIARAALENSQRLLEVVQARRAAGLATPADEAQQRAAVAAAQIRIAELDQQQSEEQAALSILVGRLPGTLEIRARQLSDFAQPRVSAGLPSQLLSRRPDVLSAEQNLRAAHADLVQARAALFPSITLTGSGGLQNPAVNAAVVTLAGVGPSLTLGGSLVQSIFDGGRLRAARDEARAAEQEMLAHYRAATLAAFWDVQIALSAVEKLNAQEDAQRVNLAQGELAFAAAQARYREGQGDFLAVLDAERAVFSAREQMSQYTLARLQAVVGLCKALGGGWGKQD